MKDIKKRKANKRRRKKKVALIIFVIFAIAIFAGLSLTVFFPVKSIKATGSEYYESTELINCSGIKIGENVLRINKKNVLLNIQKDLPFVSDITIEKNLDGNIVIKAKDSKEVFVYNCDNKYYSTDNTGRVLKNYDSLPENMLHIICETKLNEEKTYVVIEDEKKLAAINTVSTQTEFFVLNANELDVTNTHEIKMLFDNRLKVNFGDISYFNEKLAHFLKMCENENLNNVSGTINLSQYTPENPSAFFVKDKNNE